MKCPRLMTCAHMLTSLTGFTSFQTQDLMEWVARQMGHAEVENMKNTAAAVNQFQKLHDVWPIIAVLQLLDCWTEAVPKIMPWELTSMRDHNVYYRCCNALNQLEELYPTERGKWRTLCRFFIHVQHQTHDQQRWKANHMNTCTSIKTMVTFLHDTTQLTQAAAAWYDYTKAKQGAAETKKTIGYLRATCKENHSSCNTQPQPIRQPPLEAFFDDFLRDGEPDVRGVLQKIATWVARMSP